MLPLRRLDGRSSAADVVAHDADDQDFLEASKEVPTEIDVEHQDEVGPAQVRAHLLGDGVGFFHRKTRFGEKFEESFSQASVQLASLPCPVRPGACSAGCP